jgi:hypothetical protein
MKEEYPQPIPLCDHCNLPLTPLEGMAWGNKLLCRQCQKMENFCDHCNLPLTPLEGMAWGNKLLCRQCQKMEKMKLDHEKFQQEHDWQIKESARKEEEKLKQILDLENKHEPLCNCPSCRGLGDALDPRNKL